MNTSILLPNVSTAADECRADVVSLGEHKRDKTCQKAKYMLLKCAPHRAWSWNYFATVTYIVGACDGTMCLGMPVPNCTECELERV